MLTTQLLKTRSYLPFNFAVTKIRVAIRLVEDETRMGGIQFQLSPNNHFAFSVIRKFNTPKLKLLIA